MPIAHHPAMPSRNWRPDPADQYPAARRKLGRSKRAESAIGICRSANRASRSVIGPGLRKRAHSRRSARPVVGRSALSDARRSENSVRQGNWPDRPAAGVTDPAGHFERTRVSGATSSRLAKVLVPHYPAQRLRPSKPARDLSPPTCAAPERGGARIGPLCEAGRERGDLRLPVWVGISGARGSSPEGHVSVDCQRGISAASSRARWMAGTVARAWPRAVFS
jgi:hypothetical protein